MNSQKLFRSSRIAYQRTMLPTVVNSTMKMEFSPCRIELRASTARSRGNFFENQKMKGVSSAQKYQMSEPPNCCLNSGGSPVRMRVSSSRTRKKTAKQVNAAKLNTYGFHQRFTTGGSSTVFVPRLIHS